jgi:predicted RNase H-like nuclease (RuvC/YqgF family)
MLVYRLLFFFKDCPLVKKMTVLEDRLSRIGLRNQSLESEVSSLRREIESLRERAQAGADNSPLERRIRE